MLLKSEKRKQALTAGLSVAFFALMTGISQAQDATDLADPMTGDAVGDVAVDVGPVVDDGTTATDEIGDGDVTVTVDPIETLGGGPVNMDGIGDGEPLPDVVLEDDAGTAVGEEPDVTTTDFPESTCGGCEYQTMSGGPEVQREVAITQNSGGHNTLATGPQVVSDDNNICYNADLYIPLLCDWQRPFVGDRMP